jgi:LysR family glycine cleavage system transcriptional activator
MTYRLPSLNTLRAFEAAARHLSFKAAADEIGVTAGAVSQQVRNLERSLGIDLFRRLPHGLLLTTAGETYLPRITKAFEDLTTATEEIAPDMNGKKFTVGICPKAAKLLPSNWPLNDPRLKPHVRDRVKTSDVEQVRTNAVDCLIRKSGGPYGHLELFRVPYVADATGRIEQIHFICKTGLANCRQTEQILLSLEKYAATKQ